MPIVECEGVTSPASISGDQRVSPLVQALEVVEEARLRA
jgi:hypothetical protein